MQYVLIILKGGIPISFGGTEEPAAYGELVSIGGINPANNKKVSAAISELLQSKLNVPASRFYIKFYDVKVMNISTFSNFSPPRFVVSVLRLSLENPSLRIT